jgi:hypothetical protein
MCEHPSSEQVSDVWAPKQEEVGGCESTQAMRK